jgi:dUTP pyrophosphatase
MMNVKRLHKYAKIPKYAKIGDSGFDLSAVEDVIIKPGETKLIKTGLAFDIPKGYEIQVRPRSGITLKTKLRVQLGTIDSNYRGDVGIIVDNISHPGNECAGVRLIDGTPETYESDTYKIKKGDRIAQGVLAPVSYSVIKEVIGLTGTERGISGYGSTGTVYHD